MVYVQLKSIKNHFSVVYTCAFAHVRTYLLASSFYKPVKLIYSNLSARQIV